METGKVENKQQTTHVHIERDYELKLPEWFDFELPLTTYTLRYAKEGRHFYNLYQKERSELSKRLSVNCLDTKAITIAPNDKQLYSITKILREVDKTLKTYEDIDFNTCTMEEISNVPIKRAITHFTLMCVARNQRNLYALSNFEENIPFLAVSDQPISFYDYDDERKFLGGVYQYYADIIYCICKLYRSREFTSDNIKALIDYNK